MTLMKFNSPRPKALAVRAFLACLLLLALMASMPLTMPIRAASITAATSPYTSIQLDLQQGRANQAIARLNSRLASVPADAAAHQLLCRVYLQEERWPDAERECETAVRLAPDDSDNHLWLGRAYGGAAAHASLTSAYGLARKVRAEFETAVRIDPANVAALSDLGEYYVDVPRLIGGGTGRAKKIAQQLAPLSPARYHALQAKIYAREKDPTNAEREWRLAIQTSPNPADQWMDLATFYASQKNYAAMRDAIAHGVATTRHDAGPLVVAATLLVDRHQDLAHAAALLRQYLASPNQSEDVPAFRVRVQLGQVLAAMGKSAAAHRQFALAQALASGYGPAQHG